MHTVKYCRIVICLVVFFLFGCAGTQPQKSVDKPPVKIHKLDEGLEHLAKNIKQVVREGIKSGSIQAILDIAVLDVFEKTTGENLDFSSFLSSKLVNLTSDLTKEQGAGIVFIESQKIRNAIDSLPKEKAIDYRKLGIDLKSALMFKGVFFQNAEESVTIQIEIFDPAKGHIHNTVEVTIALNDISKQMRRSFPLVVAKEFDALYKQLAETKLKQIPALINKNWNNYFIESQRKSLRESIISTIFDDVEGLVIDDSMARERLGTIKKINEEKKHISLYLQGKFQIQVLDFEYNLTDQQNRKVKQAVDYVKHIESTLQKGIDVSLAFIAQTDDNDPLDFECDGDKELKIFISNTNFHYKQATCNEEGPRQVMTWLEHIHLTAKTWSIIVIEDSVFGDEEVKAHIPVTKDNLLNIYYKGKDEIILTGSQHYMVRFTRKD